MSQRHPDWATTGKDWPNRRASRFVEADTYRWHVQDMGPERVSDNAAEADASETDASEAPVCLLIHGTGASTHSWRDLMPILAHQYRVIAMDLPGHGFTRASHQRRVGLPQIAASLDVLLRQMDIRPDVIVGHSAGAAIAIDWSVQQQAEVPIVGLNPALLPFPGLAAKLFPTLAKVLFTNPFVAQIFARMARGPGQMDRFIPKATGSTIDRTGTELYRQMLSHPGHCDGALRMMASWDLDALEKRLPDVCGPVLLVHGARDKAIPRSAVYGASNRIAGCEFEELAKLGHLAHEEKPQQIAQIITAFADRARG